jgi:hypothetical protein
MRSEYAPKKVSKNKIKRRIVVPKVIVYYFKKYDPNSDQMVLSKSMTTLKEITKNSGVPLWEGAKEVDTSDLDGNGFYREKKNNNILFPPHTQKLIALTK